MIVAGLMAAQAIFGFMSQRRIAKAQARQAEATYKAQEMVRLANNQFEATRATLAEWQRTRMNQKILRRAGEDRNAMSENFNRSMDRVVNGGIADQVRNSEELGRIAAMAGAAGVGGSTISMISDTTRRVQNVMEQQKQQELQYARTDFVNQRSGVMENAILSLDENINMANMNVQETMKQYVPKPSVGNLAMDLAGIFIGQRNQNKANISNWMDKAIEANKLSIQDAAAGGNQNGLFRPRNANTTSPRQRRERNFFSRSIDWLAGGDF